MVESCPVVVVVVVVVVVLIVIVVVVPVVYVFLHKRVVFVVVTVVHFICGTVFRVVTSQFVLLVLPLHIICWSSKH